MEPLKYSTNSKEGRKGKKKKGEEQLKEKKRHNKIVDLKPSIHIIMFKGQILSDWKKKAKLNYMLSTRNLY